MVSARIEPSDLHGEIIAPGSKSVTQRAILISVFSGSPLLLQNPAFCDDDIVAIGIAEACGMKVKRYTDKIEIKGRFTCPEKIEVGESGTSLRLVIGLLSAMGCKTRIDMQTSLAGRPVDDLLHSLVRNSVSFQKAKNTLFIDASKAVTGESIVDASMSSQFVSSLLLYQALKKEDRRVRTIGKQVSHGYVDLTKRVLESFGPVVTSSNGNYEIKGLFKNEQVNMMAEGDYSSASYLLALGLLASHKGVVIHGLSADTLLPDSTLFINTRLASKVGADSFVAKRMDYIPEITIDADISPDLAPVVASIGIFSKAGVTILNPGRLNVKESDRYSEIIRLCTLFGASFEDTSGRLHISSGKMLHPETLEFTEHRMIMAGIVAGLASGHAVTHMNVERIAKSYPSFLNDLRKLGASVSEY